MQQRVARLVALHQRRAVLGSDPEQTVIQRIVEKQTRIEIVVGDGRARPSTTRHKRRD